RHVGSTADAAPTQRELLINHRNAAIRRLAAQLFKATSPRARKSVVDEYQAALKLRGIASSGRAVFEKNCSTCHQLGGKGYAIGPNLASSPSRDPATLL